MGSTELSSGILSTGVSLVIVTFVAGDISWTLTVVSIVVYTVVKHVEG